MTEYIKNYPKQQNCDGIIMAPTKNAANTTLKWKPDELNTVDLRVHILNENKAILLCATKTSEDLYEYNRKSVKIQGIIKNKEVISKLSHTKIYEFTYNKDTAEFTPIKERTDKVKPNYIEVVHDNLETILYPVNIELIKRNQDRFFNLKRFHNWVKRNFLQKYASYKNCIDIGCGRGGDIQKWFDYKIKYIEAYDINEESITEAVNRYTLYKNNNIYKSNYNYNFIIKDLNESESPLDKSEDIDVITGFFCMHYFIKNFDVFFENIKSKMSQGTLFICSFQDSDKIDELIENTKTPINEYYIEKKGQGKIDICMCDTIVQNTREEDVLTNTEITELFKSKNFELVENCEFQKLYKPWCEANNRMDEYETDISFL
jgi:SAM-dependent methyltransferase